MGEFFSITVPQDLLIMLHLALLLCVAAPSLAARLPYIVNGVDAAPGEFPWQASLQIYGQHTCGASLVSDQWLVCASHCIQKNYLGGYTIVMGAHDKDTNKEGAPHRYSIHKMITHPKWNGDLSVPSDISLIKLADPVEMNEFVSTIDLPNKDDDFTGQNCVISGWGSLYGAGTQLPNVLQKLEVEVYSRFWCRMRMVPGAGDGYQLCVRNKGSSACTGDSGGPLACKKDGRWTLAGAASFVFGNCSTKFPTVYTSVAYFRDWIKEHTGL